MEKYRSALYRYSTGHGFSVNTEIPNVARNVASYKMLPLQAKHINQGSAVDVKREADRLSMQEESANRQLLTLGYDPVAGRRYRKLKNRVDALRHLISSYPIRLIRVSDLDLIYKYYAEGSPKIDSIIQRVLKYNKGGSDVFTKTAAEVRKGYPLYDKFGVQLSSKGLGEWSNALQKAREHPLLAALAVVAVAIGFLKLRERL